MSLQSVRARSFPYWFPESWISALTHIGFPASALAAFDSILYFLPADFSVRMSPASADGAPESVMSVSRRLKRF